MDLRLAPTVLLTTWAAMCSVEQLEFAAFVARQCCVLREPFTPLQDRALYRYWSAARSRLDRWGLAFRRIRQLVLLGAEMDAYTQGLRKQLLEEVFLCEPLIRVLTLVLQQRDRNRREVSAGPIGRSIFLGTLDVRRQALDLLLQSSQAATSEAAELNTLRMRIERWMDVLLGRVATPSDAILLQELAIEPERARDFIPQYATGSQEAWPLLLASLRMSVPEDSTSPLSPNDDLHAEVAGSVLSMLEPPLFHESGLPRSLFQLQMQNCAEDMQWLLARYDVDDGTPLPAGPRESSVGRRFAGRHRRF